MTAVLIRNFLVSNNYHIIGLENNMRPQYKSDKYQTTISSERKQPSTGKKCSNYLKHLYTI